MQTFEPHGYQPIVLAAYHYLEQVAASGANADSIDPEASLAAGAIARGIMLALASPEWAIAILRMGGASGELVAQRIEECRAFIADHPAALAAVSR